MITNCQLCKKGIKETGKLSTVKFDNQLFRKKAFKLCKECIKKLNDLNIEMWTWRKIE